MGAKSTGEREKGESGRGTEAGRKGENGKEVECWREMPLLFVTSGDIDSAIATPLLASG